MTLKSTLGLRHSVDFCARYGEILRKVYEVKYKITLHDSNLRNIYELMWGQGTRPWSWNHEGNRLESQKERERRERGERGSGTLGE